MAPLPKPQNNTNSTEEEKKSNYVPPAIDAATAFAMVDDGTTFGKLSDDEDEEDVTTEVSPARSGSTSSRIPSELEEPKTAMDVRNSLPKQKKRVIREYIPKQKPVEKPKQTVEEMFAELEEGSLPLPQKEIEAMEKARLAREAAAKMSIHDVQSSSSSPAEQQPIEEPVEEQMVDDVPMPQEDNVQQDEPREPRLLMFGVYIYDDEEPEQSVPVKEPADEQMVDDVPMPQEAAAPQPPAEPNAPVRARKAPRKRATKTAGARRVQQSARRLTVEDVQKALKSKHPSFKAMVALCLLNAKSSLTPPQILFFLLHHFPALRLKKLKSVQSCVRKVITMDENKNWVKADEGTAQFRENRSYRTYSLCNRDMARQIAEAALQSREFNELYQQFNEFFDKMLNGEIGQPRPEFYVQIANKFPLFAGPENSALYYILVAAGQQPTPGDVDDEKKPLENGDFKQQCNPKLIGKEPVFEEEAYPFEDPTQLAKNHPSWAKMTPSKEYDIDDKELIVANVGALFEMQKQWKDGGFQDWTMLNEKSIRDVIEPHRQNHVEAKKAREAERQAQENQNVPMINAPVQQQQNFQNMVYTQNSSAGFNAQTYRAPVQQQSQHAQNNAQFNQFVNHNAPVQQQMQMTGYNAQWVPVQQQSPVATPSPKPLSTADAFFMAQMELDLDFDNYTAPIDYNAQIFNAQIFNAPYANRDAPVYHTMDAPARAQNHRYHPF